MTTHLLVEAGHAARTLHTGCGARLTIRPGGPPVGMTRDREQVDCRDCLDPNQNGPDPTDDDCCRHGIPRLSDGTYGCAVCEGLPYY